MWPFAKTGKAGTKPRPETPPQRPPMWPNFDPLSDRLHGDDPASTYELVYPGGTRETWLDKAARDRAVDVDFLANYTPMADGQAPDKTRAEQLRRREVKALERLAAAAEKQANKQP